MDSEVFPAEGRAGSRYASLARVGKDLFLGDQASRSPRVNNIVGREAIESSPLIVGNVRQELLNEADQLIRGTSCLFCRLRAFSCRTIERNPVTGQGSQNENDPAQRDRSSYNSVCQAHPSSVSTMRCQPAE